MNKRQKEILEAQLKAEQQTLEKLKKIYKKALDDIDSNIAALMGRKDVENLQSIIYQVQYQKALKQQINGILDQMNAEQFESISEYLTKCYENGFFGAMYDLHGQGIPIITPIVQDQIIKALTNDSKLSKNLYDSLGENVSLLKKRIQNNISRGLAQGSSYADIARNIASGMVGDYGKFNGGALYFAHRITRTEGHRIQNQAAMDAQKKAKEKGADIVKQWDATLDKRTRPEHAKAHGQLREIEDDFDVWGEKLQAPGIGGSAKNVINCRCACLQRAKWALDEDELKTLEEHAKYFGLDKTSDFEDFKKKYLNANDVLKKAETQKNATNKFGDTILFDDKIIDQYPKSVDIVNELSNEYNTRLITVKVGAKQAAVTVDISGATMRLSSKDQSTTIHEFAHTLSNSKATKYGLTNDNDFWKEIKKIRTAYHKDVDKTGEISRRISFYEHGSKSIDEFMAEAFALAKMSEMKIPIPDKYGNDLTYANKVLEVIDKFFKKS